MMRLLRCYIAGFKYALLQSTFIDPYWDSMLTCLSRMGSLFVRKSKTGPGQGACRFSRSCDEKMYHRKTLAVCQAAQDSLQTMSSKSDAGSLSEMPCLDASEPLCHFSEVPMSDVGSDHHIPTRSQRTNFQHSIESPGISCFEASQSLDRCSMISGVNDEHRHHQPYQSQELNFPVQIGMCRE